MSGAAILDWAFDHVMPWFLIIAMGILLLILLVGIPYAIYDYTVAEKFELRKDEWVCTKSHEVSTTTYIMVGNVMVPSTTTSTVCDQWSRK